MSLNPFPGPQPYRAADRHRFHGRDELSRKLLGSILAHRAVTVFGPSGAGKSSLMQASVIPQLIDEHQFRVVRVDSWPEETTAATWLADAMIDGFKLGVDNKETTPAATVLAAAQRAARKSSRPFLIYLDQVEQLLYHSRNPAEMIEFAEIVQGLAELPIQGLKLVLLLREDYLGPLRDQFEGRAVLLDYGFRVGPMRVGELAQAMCKVAATGEPAQTWTLEDTRTLVMQVRVDGQAARDEAEAQAAFAQIVCRAIFDKRASGQTTEGESLDVAKVLEGYLETTLSGLGELNGQAQVLLENHLITPDGSRTLRTEKELSASFPPDVLATILTKLEAAAILRAEEHQGRRYFELGHDWLGKQVLARIERERREAEALRRMREVQQTVLEQVKSFNAQADKLAKEKWRLRIITLLVVTIAIAALAFALPAIRSYFDNKEMARNSQRLIDSVHSIDWSNPDGIQGKLEKLESVRLLIDTLERQQRTEIPSVQGRGAHETNPLLGSLRKEYHNALHVVFALRVQKALKSRLADPGKASFLEQRSMLRQYLLLGEPSRLEFTASSAEPGDGALLGKAAIDDADEFAWTWAVELRPATLGASTINHVQWYLRELKSGRTAPLLVDENLVKQARSRLLGIPASERHYDALISSVNEMRVTDNATASRSLKFVPLLLPDVLLDRSGALKFVTSKRFEREKIYAEVQGAYTHQGHYQVLLNLKMANLILERDAWLLGQATKSDPADIEAISAEYESRYIRQWDDFLRDIEVAPPATVSDAIDLYGMLTRRPWPFMSILHAAYVHTQWNSTTPASLGLDANTFDPMLVGDLSVINGRQSIVPPTFASLLFFSKSDGNPRHIAFLGTHLEAYINILTDLRQTMKQMSQPPSATAMIRLSEELSGAAVKVEALLQPRDDRAKEFLRPWLMNPLRIKGTKLNP